MVKKILKIVGIVIGALVLVVLIYLAYVLLSFHRIDDYQELQVNGTPEQKTAVAGEEYTITSYNIGFGAYSDDYTFFMDGGKESRARSAEAVYENIGGAMSVINEKDPDFSLFQEVDFDGTRSWHVDERELVTAGMSNTGDYNNVWAQNYDSPYLMYPLSQPHGANKSCIMTFSRVQINSAIRRSVPIETGISKVLDLDRCYSKSRVDVDNGKELIIYDLHFSAYTSSSETAENQLKQMIEDMSEEYAAGNYCVAGGDFNRDLLGNSPEVFDTVVLADNWAKPIPMELFTDEITLVVPYSVENHTASCRNPDKPYEEGDFVVTVDGFVVSANVEVIEADVINTGFKYSDHNPVYMNFVLKK